MAKNARKSGISDIPLLLLTDPMSIFGSCPIDSVRITGAFLIQQSCTGSELLNVDSYQLKSREEQATLSSPPHSTSMQLGPMQWIKQAGLASTHQMALKFFIISASICTLIVIADLAGKYLVINRFSCLRNAQCTYSCNKQYLFIHSFCSPKEYYLRLQNVSLSMIPGN